MGTLLGVTLLAAVAAALAGALIAERRRTRRIEAAVLSLVTPGGTAAPGDLERLPRTTGAAVQVLRDRLADTVRIAQARAGVASELNRTQPLESALQAVCRELRVGLRGGAAVVAVRQADLGDPFVVADGLAAPLPEAPELLDGDGPFGVAAHAHGPVYATATAGTVESSLGLRNLCAAPLRMGANVLGVVAVSCEEQVHGEEAALVDIAAQQLTLALERYRFLAVMQHRATTDELTGLYNYRFLIDHLEQQVALAERLQRPLSVLMLDLDHFKRLNDTHGHHAGDVALQTFAASLQHCIRRADVAARYGGEEFAVVMANTSVADARAVAEKIRAAVREAVLPLDGAAAQARITVSIGCAAFPDSASSARELLDEADAALYHAKHGGRDRVCMAEDVRLVAGPATGVAGTGRRHGDPRARRRRAPF